jgi:integrase
MLTLRQRGPARIWYLRGSVTLGQKRIDVAEFSTGTDNKEAAEHFRNKKEEELRHELMFGPKVRLNQFCIADALLAYLNKPTRPNSADTARAGKLNEILGDRLLTEAKQAWLEFRETQLARHKPAGQDRYRQVLQAALNVFHERLDLPAVKLKTIPFKNQRVRFLTSEEQDRLLASYAPHVQPIALVLCYQGARTQEALQLRWSEVNFDRNTIWFSRTKSKIPRTNPMHPKVAGALKVLWEKAGRPVSGNVFLNRLSEPYTDTRDLKVQGGNPLTSAHRTACKRAGITNFRVHDWRHHWASQMMMAGCDFRALMDLGGWLSHSMVMRYAAVSSDHLKKQILLLH